jgi:hypothetical protein
MFRIKMLFKLKNKLYHLIKFLRKCTKFQITSNINKLPKELLNCKAKSYTVNLQKDSQNTIKMRKQIKLMTNLHLDSA